MDGIKTNLAPTGQSPTCEGRSRAPVETREKEIQEERINQKTPTHICREDIWKIFEQKEAQMGTANSKRKFL